MCLRSFLQAWVVVLLVVGSVLTNQQRVLNEVSLNRSKESKVRC